MPFNGEYDQAIIYSILNEMPETLYGDNPDLPSKLDKAITKMLEKNPENRFQEMNYVIAALEALRNGGFQDSVVKLRRSISLPKLKHFSVFA
jgi:serine/threonine protein kinase